jgi:MGT family glycosyltransferase
MSRFLFVVLPQAGHVNPSAAVAKVLAEHGHQVAWCGSPARLRPWLDPGATIYPTGMRVFRGRSDTGMSAVKSLWQDFVVPFTRFIMPAVEKAVLDYRPDVVVADQHALAGSLVAQRLGLPWATLCTSSMELAHPFRELPKVDGWIREQLRAVTSEAGLSPDVAEDPRFSPHLVIVFASAALLPGQSFPGQPSSGQPFPGQPFPGQFALVGPALSARPGTPPFPWDRLDPARRQVLVTVGTMADEAAAMHFYSRAVQALSPLGDRLQAIVNAPPGPALPRLPEHIIALDRIPMLSLMPRLDAVLCHGGMNTVCEALSHGLPIVVAPLARDQPINAAAVVSAGAGLRVHFQRASPEQLRACVLEVLDDPAYRIAAGRIRESFTAAGGAAEAAARLERLAERTISLTVH